MSALIARRAGFVFLAVLLCVLAQAQSLDQRLPGEPGPPFLLKWGSSGTAESQFNMAWSVSVDASGYVYVADSSNHRIQKFDSSGSFLLMWGRGVDGGTSVLQVCTSGCQAGSSGGGDGELNGPFGVGVDAVGNVYVADAYNHRIQKFDSGGAFLLMWGWEVNGGTGVFETCTSGCQAGASGSGNGQFDMPVAVTVDATGNVYVADHGNDRIQMFDSNGTLLTKWGSYCDTTASGVDGCDGRFDALYGVAADAFGNVYVADAGNSRVQKFNASGTFLTKWGSACNTDDSGVHGCDGQFDFLTDVAVDADGAVYTTEGENDRVQMFDGNGALLRKWGSTGTGDGELKAPTSVAVDASGNVYVLEMDNNRVQKFGPVTEGLVFLGEWGVGGTGSGEFGDPYGVAADASGNIYVADYGNHRIQKFDSDGTFVSMWGWGVDSGAPALEVCSSGCRAGSPGSGDGQLAGPIDVAVDGSGDVYVSEYGNHRIQKFSSSGTFLAKWGTSGIVEGRFNRPGQVAVDATGNVYVADADNHRVQKFDSSGTFVLMWGWEVDGGAGVFEICTSGCQAGAAGSGNGQLDRPYGVAVDASGNVYVAAIEDPRVQKFSSGGAYLTQWGSIGSGDGEFSNPAAAATDGSGNVYVSDSGLDRIQKFDSSGAFLLRWGGYGTTPVMFDIPSGIAVDALGDIYVADLNNQRIQKFGKCSFAAVPGSGSYGSSSGSDSFNVDAVIPTCAWSATADWAWITLSPEAVVSGDGAVNFSLLANPTGIARHGSITISDETTGGPGSVFNISQAAAPCAYGLSPGSGSIGGTGGSDSVAVSTLLGCAWTAVSNNGWISVDSGSPGVGSGTVSYSVSANAGGSARSGSMTIAGQTFTVNQDSQVPDAPSNLVAAAMNSTKVQLAWQDNAGNEDEIRVERKLGASGTFARILTLPQNVTGATDSQVEKHTTYVYRVMACNSFGCSAPSAEVSVTTPALGIFIGDALKP